MIKTAREELILPWIKRFLFPDFSNQLTMVVTLAGVALLTDQLWIGLVNWGIGLINLAGLSIPPIPQLPFHPDPAGLLLIALALAYNLAAKAIGLRLDNLKHQISREKRLLDMDLYARFLELLPSDGPDVTLLKNHDFANSFLLADLNKLGLFTHVWGNAENRFLNAKVEAGKTAMLDFAKDFLEKVATYTAPKWNGYQTVYPKDVDPEIFVPEHVRQEIRELNSGATALYQHHQNFVCLCREQL